MAYREHLASTCGEILMGLLSWAEPDRGLKWFKGMLEPTANEPVCVSLGRWLLTK